MPNHYAEQEEEIRKEQKEHRKKIMKENAEAAITIELPDKTVLKLALQAHERDITLNKMMNIILKDGLKKTDYVQQSTPQLLNETK